MCNNMHCCIFKNKKTREFHKKDSNYIGKRRSGIVPLLKQIRHCWYLILHTRNWRTRKQKRHKFNNTGSKVSTLLFSIRFQMKQPKLSLSAQWKKHFTKAFLSDLFLLFFLHLHLISYSSCTHLFLLHFVVTYCHEMDAEEKLTTTRSTTHHLISHPLKNEALDPNIWSRTITMAIAKDASISGSMISRKTSRPRVTPCADSFFLISISCLRLLS